MDTPTRISQDGIETAPVSAGWMECQGRHAARTWALPLLLGVMFGRPTPARAQQLHNGTDISREVDVIAGLTASKEERREIPHRSDVRDEAAVLSKTVWIALVVGAGASVLTALAVLAWNRALLRRVRQRASQLQTELARRQESENALQEAYECIHDLIASVHVMVVGLDAEGHIRMFNECAERVTGYSMAELEGANWFETIVSKDRYAYVSEIFSNYQEKTGSMPAVFENPILTKSGEERIISWLTCAIGLPGRDISTVSFGMDITDRKRAEVELQRSSEMLRTIVDTAPTPIIGLDLDGYVRFVWNRAAERVLGWSATEAMGHLLPSVPQERQQEFRELRERIRHGKTLDGVEVGRRRRDGSPIDYSIHAAPLHDSEGTIIGKLAVLVDITDRKMAEEKLRRSEKGLADAQRIAHLGNWELDLVNNVLTWSDEIFCIFEIDRNQFGASYEAFLNAVHPEDRDLVNNAYVDSVKNKTVYDIVHRLQMPDGRIKYVNEKCETSYGEQGTPLRSVGTVLDITARKLAEDEVRELNAALEKRVAERTAELEEVNRELEAFAYSVSHDLRAPLRHMDGFVELLRGRLAATEDEDVRHYMEVISSSAKSMGRLISHLLDFSRMSRAQLAFESVGLAGLVPEVIENLESDSAGRKISWEVADLPTVTGDRAMLGVVFTNLLANAMKFTRPRETAVIRVGWEPGDRGEVVLFVRDNGVGFDPISASKLFGVFQRLHRPEDFEGTGIGLANVRRIVSRHGGRTWAEGALDQGAAFYFSLPPVKEE